MAWVLEFLLLLDSCSLEKKVTCIQINKLQTHVSIIVSFLFKLNMKAHHLLNSSFIEFQRHVI